MTDKRLQRWLSRAYNPGNWYKFPVMYLHIMSRDAAILLSFLHSLSYRVLADERSDGWFYCTLKRVEEELAMDKNVQRRILKELQERKFIDWKRKGLPPRRHILINYETIENALDGIKLPRQIKEESNGFDADY